MKNNFIFKIYVALASLAGLAHLAIAGEDDISPQVLARYVTHPEMRVDVSVELANLYVSPDASHAPAWTHPWTQRLEVDSQKLSIAPPGWIPIKRTGDRLSNEKQFTKAEFPTAWIRRRDVSLWQDEKKVVRCWPIKTVTFVGGDYSAVFTFNVDGSASVKEWGDEAWINKKPPSKAHVYKSNNLVYVRGKSTYFVLGYRPTDRALFPKGIAGEHQEWFPESMLKGCETGPKLAP